MRFELEMQVVEFFFDTCARFKDLSVLFDDVVLAFVSGFFVAARAHALPARRHEVSLCHRGTQEDTEREQWSKERRLHHSSRCLK
jgi:hypothetical protein